jgi:hypothetical protein
VTAGRITKPLRRSEALKPQRPAPAP